MEFFVRVFFLSMNFLIRGINLFYTFCDRTRSSRSLNTIFQEQPYVRHTLIVKIQPKSLLNDNRIDSSRLFLILFLKNNNKKRVGRFRGFNVLRTFLACCNKRSTLSPRNRHTRSKSTWTTCKICRTDRWSISWRWIIGNETKSQRKFCNAKPKTTMLPCRTPRRIECTRETRLWWLRAFVGHRNRIVNETETDE